MERDPANAVLENVPFLHTTGNHRYWLRECRVIGCGDRHVHPGNDHPFLIFVHDVEKNLFQPLCFLDGPSQFPVDESATRPVSDQFPDRLDVLRGHAALPEEWKIRPLGVRPVQSFRFDP